MNETLTSEIIGAYAQCPRKAYLLLPYEKGITDEYSRIIERRKLANQSKYLDVLRQQHFELQTYNDHNLLSGNSFLSKPILRSGVLEARCGLLTIAEQSSSLGDYSYEATVFAGTYCVDKFQKLELIYASYILGLLQSKAPSKGRIVTLGPKLHNLNIKEVEYKLLKKLIDTLKESNEAFSHEMPPVILNQHCSCCQFHDLCYEQAEKEDSLSLLNHITPKIIKRYEKKGVFTVKQLSFLYKPRRHKKQTRKPPPSTHKPELQALALRTGKIYLQTLPELTYGPDYELFLDVEGLPDQQYDYLIGLLVRDELGVCTQYSYWADTPNDEYLIWQQFVEKVTQYPNVPIYHYGDYEVRALNRMAKRYCCDSNDFRKLRERLVNVNKYVYGHIYFPTYSNRLKEIGKYIGAKWTSPNSSGLQSIVWRYQWEETRDTQFKNLLVTYNHEDCLALKLLTDKLVQVKFSADTLLDVDFADQPKRNTTKIGKELHDQFQEILKYAHNDYDKKKICLNRREKEKIEARNTGGQKGHKGHGKIITYADKIVSLPMGSECPKHSGEYLQKSNQIAESVIIDLSFMESKIEKIITKYVGEKGYCQKCHKYYRPSGIDSNYVTYAHGFRVWVIYHRLFLRLPYRIITQELSDELNEEMSEGTIANFIRYFSDYYCATEKLLTQRILESPFIHVDETKINIQGAEQYVWVFTDGKHVIFKLTATRESDIVRNFLADYDGVLISDFYPGYDSMMCRQQKCWSHLIRDMNDDLWNSPFDSEFESFVLKVRNLIVPILEKIDECGSKAEHLNKFTSLIEQFYIETINRDYRSDLALKYQKRFSRYRESLFVFTQYDNIPWNNNTGERAIRHLAVQRKISGCFFESITPQYLFLLGIMQTCRFQEKSLLKFLLSKETDVDKFAETV